MKTRAWFGSSRQALQIGLLWSPISLAAIVLHKTILGSSWAEATILLLPPMLVELFISLGTRFLCRSTPIRLQTLFKGGITHLAALAILTGTWLVLILVYSSMLESLTGNPAWRRLFTESIPFLTGTGIALYCLSVLFHYSVLANQAARQAERDALNQQLYTTEAELRALRSTIHPHFLFNSLNAVGPLIDQSPARARRFIEQLADFFRYSLKYSGEKTVRLRDELDHVRNYLEIEAIRFGERLRVNYELDPDILERPVLSLVLLPLVENAVKHGISQCLHGGELTVSVRPDGDYTAIEVRNPWEPPSRPPRGEGLGIRTLEQRLHFQYGDTARCIVHREPALFTVRILIPAAKESVHAR